MLERSGFYLSGSADYRQYLTDHPNFEKNGHTLLKEWDLFREASGKDPSPTALQDLEQKLGVATLWEAIVADRRLLSGPEFGYRLNYSPQFTHSEMLSIALSVFRGVEKLFDDVQPSFVVSFICVTIGEYAAYLIARSRGIPFLNLRPSRIRNYFTYGEGISEPSQLVRSTYEKRLKQPPNDDWDTLAEKVLGEFRGGFSAYEGVLPAAHAKTSSPKQTNSVRRGNLVTKIAGLAASEYRRRRDEVKGDNRTRGIITAMLYQRLFNPRLADRVRRQFSQDHVKEAELRDLEYAFFPLHMEPEVTLLVYSRPYLNQIETARQIALNLPSGMSLIIKEHPAALGKRKSSYYRKLLDIPNVRLADPHMNISLLLDSAKLVATIAGSAGLEAVVRRKPVLLFGHTPFEILPDSMVRRVGALESLAELIQDLRNSHTHDENALKAYFASVMSRSIPVNFYTRVLGRSGISLAQTNISREDEIELLANYTLETIAGMTTLNNLQQDLPNNP